MTNENPDNENKKKSDAAKPETPPPSGLGHFIRSFLNHKPMASLNDNEKKREPEKAKAIERVAVKAPDAVIASEHPIDTKTKNPKRQSKKEAGKQPRLDSRCLTCTGITYFSKAMKHDTGGQDSSALATCFGFKEQLSAPPPPFALASEVEAAATEQSENKIEEDSKIFFLCFGKSVVTTKMIKEGSVPYCMEGKSLALTMAVDIVEDSQSPTNRKQPQEHKPKAPQQDGEKSREVRIPFLSGAVSLFPFLASPSAFFEHTKTTAKKVSDFWIKAPVNFPERYMEFSKRLVGQMETTVEGSFQFGTKILGYWLGTDKRQ